MLFGKLVPMLRPVVVSEPPELTSKTPFPKLSWPTEI